MAYILQHILYDILLQEILREYSATICCKCEVLQEINLVLSAAGRGTVLHSSVLVNSCVFVQDAFSSMVLVACDGDILTWTAITTVKIIGTSRIVSTLLWINSEINNWLICKRVRRCGVTLIIDYTIGCCSMELRNFTVHTTFAYLADYNKLLQIMLFVLLIYYVECAVYLTLVNIMSINYRYLQFSQWTLFI